MAEPTDQKVEMLWETPSPDEIVEITKSHVASMEQTDDDAVWFVAGMHHVLLHTIGRKSGTEHRVALPTWNDPNGHRIVVGSFAGATKHPAWFLNLRDREPGTMIKVFVQGARFWSDAQILEGDDHTATWDGLVADRAWYTDYQAKTDRPIPLVRLPETRPYEGD